MSKKEVSKKNLKLSNLAIILVIIASALIILSNSMVKTLLILVGAVTILFFIGRKIDKIKK